jgi:YD repeat-containing protein
VASINPLGKRSTSVYDKARRLVAQVNALGFRTTLSYDAVGRQIQVKDPLSRITTSVFDSAGIRRTVREFRAILYFQDEANVSLTAVLGYSCAANWTKLPYTVRMPNRL